MSSILTVQGSIADVPSEGTPGVDSSIELDERMLLATGMRVIPIDLGADAPVVVDLTGATNVHALAILADAKVRVRITSADGATQAVPVDGLLLLFSKSVPITAIDLTRVAGVATSVRVLIGSKL